MSVDTLSRPVGTGATDASPRPARIFEPTTVPARPSRRTGRGTGPAARPARRLDAAPVVRRRRPQACTVTTPQPATQPTRWRLTERGIAWVLVLGLIIATAAMAVVALTAVRVTGDRYHAGGGLSAFQRVS